MKRAALLAKLQTYTEVVGSGLMTLDQIRLAMAKAIEGKTFRKMRSEEFVESTPELLQFAESLGVIKASKGAGRGNGRARGSSYEKLARQQYPELEAGLAIVDQLKTKTYPLTMEDGSVENVAFQPYFRKVVVKQSEQNADTVSV